MFLWQSPHEASSGCGAGGGMPWQLSQVTWLPSTMVQSGEVCVPPEGRPPTKLPPWQNVPEHLPES